MDAAMRASFTQNNFYIAKRQTLNLNEILVSRDIHRKHSQRIAICNVATGGDASYRY